LTRPVDLDADIEAADVIVTITTATAPRFPDGLMCRGPHVTAIGADCPGRQELPTGLIPSAAMRVCNMARQFLHHGEFQTASRADGAL
jgi:ornithine cyclodeaminase